MLLIYNQNANKSGIYEIKNILSGKSYIGSAKTFKTRWLGHSSSLKTKKHQCKHLQNSFNKYVEEQNNDNFIEFHILEVMENSSKEDRLIREEYWINEYKKQGIELYNSQLNPTKEPINRSCFSLSPELTKEKLSKASKQKWQDPNYLAKNPCGTSQEKSQRMLKLWQDENFREKMLKTIKVVSHKAENIKNLVERSQKTYNGLIAPDGTVYSPITNLSKFARENNLIYINLYQLVTGVFGQYNGWKSIDNPNPTRKKVTLSDEHKIKIGLSKKGHKFNVGRVHSQEAKEKMSSSRKGKSNVSAIGNKNMLGKKMSNETKEKMSEIKKRHALEKYQKEADTLQITLEELFLLKKENIKKYQKEYKMKKSTPSTS